MKKDNPGNWFYKIENLHPYQTLLYLGMFGSGLIFLFLAIAFLASQDSPGIYGEFNLPQSFIVSSMFLVGSAYTSSKIMPSFLTNSLPKTKRFLTGTLLLGLSFSGFQFLGWKELAAKGIDFTGLPSGSFLYVLSGIHLFHLLGAMIYALVLIVQIQKSETDQVKGIILLSNPYEKMKLDLFSIYWKFMDVVWIVLFVLFIWMFHF
ncbi:MAG: cytochrome C oxidase subunit III [Cyclobacteriaceae bacterium]